MTKRFYLVAKWNAVYGSIIYWLFATRADADHASRNIVSGDDTPPGAVGSLSVSQVKLFGLGAARNVVVPFTVTR